MSKRVPFQPPSIDPPLIAFVGEAPSDEEVSKGVPFVGPAGKIFDAMMRTAGLERSEYLVTNVFDQKAPRNDVAPWMIDPDIYMPALLRLQDEIDHYKPTVVVPMGGTALWAFTGDKGIMNFRGTPIAATRVAEGIKLLPTLHPSFVQKQWKYYAVVAGDFVKAQKEAERGPSIVYPARKLHLGPSLKQVEEFFERAHQAPVLSVDIETGWGDITSFGVAISEDEAMSVPFLDKRNPSNSYWLMAHQEVRAWELIRELMATDIPKLGQNFPYDLIWLWAKKGVRVMNYRQDTRLLHHALYPELPKDLKFMAAAYSAQAAWKHWGGRYSKEKNDD